MNLFQKDLSLNDLPLVTLPENENIFYFNHTEVKSAINLSRGHTHPQVAKPTLVEWHEVMARCQLMATKTLPFAPWQEWLARHFTSTSMNMFAVLMPNGTRTDFRLASREEQIARVLRHVGKQTTAALVEDILRQDVHSTTSNFVETCIHEHLEISPILPFFQLQNDFSHNHFDLSRDEALSKASLLIPSLRDGIMALGGSKDHKAKILQAVCGRGVLLQIVAAIFLAAYHGINLRPLYEAIADLLEAAALTLNFATRNQVPTRSNFSTDQLARIEAAEVEATERLNEFPPTRKYPRSLTTYQRRLTMKAAQRDGDKSNENKQRIYTLFRQVWREDCSMCGINLTVFALNGHVPNKPGQHQSTTWANASPDRIIPGRRGGEYEEHNIAFCCLWCNILKWIYQLEQVTAFLAALAAIDGIPVGADGLLNGDSLHCETPAISTLDLEYIPTQAERITHQAKAKAKATGILFTITTADSLRLPLNAWAGQGRVRSPNRPPPANATFRTGSN
ncbi:unnamed protein product [Sympodiomycopsis kandeliae]